MMRPTPALVVAFGVALLAVALPAGELAGGLTEARPDLTRAVTTGAWIFKALLAVHAAALVALDRWRLRFREGPALAPAPPSRAVSRAGTTWAVVLLLVAALALRLPALDEGLWYDEVTTLTQHVRLPVRGIVTTYESQNQQPVYSLAAHASIAVFGESAWALRLPAVLFGVASLVALWVFGRRVLSDREAALAVGLLAVSYHHVWFSQNARGYTGLLLGTILMSLFFLDMIRGDGRRGLRPVIAYAAVACLTLYTNVTAAFVIAAHGMIWLALMWARGEWRNGLHWRPIVASALGTTLGLQLYALVLPQFLTTLFPAQVAAPTGNWRSPIWFLAETLRGLAAGVPGGVVGVVAGTTVATAGLWALVRRDRVVAAMMVVPGLLMALALLILDHNLWPRLFFFSFGFAALIAIRGLGELARLVGARRAPQVATVAGVVLLAGSAVTVPRAWGPKQDYEGALRYVEAQRAPDDAVVTVDLSRFPYSRYLSTDWTPVDGPEELEQLERRHARTWVLYTFPTRLSVSQPEIWRRLQQDYREVVAFPGTVGGGDIVVKVRG